VTTYIVLILLFFALGLVNLLLGLLDKLGLSNLVGCRRRSHLLGDGSLRDNLRVALRAARVLLLELLLLLLLLLAKLLLLILLLLLLLLLLLALLLLLLLVLLLLLLMLLMLLLLLLCT
jgi:hypothetical protein